MAVTVRIDDVDAIEKLIDVGFLSERDRDNIAAITAALQDVCDIWFESDA